MRFFFILLWFCTAALAEAAQTPRVRLSVNPTRGLREKAPAATRVLFVAEAVGKVRPHRVMLCSLDAEDAVVSELGQMRDDGAPPDETAADGKFSLEIEIPLNRAGMFRFAAMALYDPPAGELAPEPEAFFVMAHTPMNDHGSMMAIDAGPGGNHLLSYGPLDAGVYSIRLYRSAAESGPWLLAAEQRHDGSAEEAAITIMDPDPDSSSGEWYYKIEFRDAAGRLKKTFPVLFVPESADSDRLLVLGGTPLSARPAPPKKTAPAAP